MLLVQLVSGVWPLADWRPCFITSALCVCKNTLEAYSRKTLSTLTNAYTRLHTQHIHTHIHTHTHTYSLPVGSTVHCAWARLVSPSPLYRRLPRTCPTSKLFIRKTYITINCIISNIAIQVPQKETTRAEDIVTDS
jgi:hypothetical protein